MTSRAEFQIVDSILVTCPFLNASSGAQCEFMVERYGVDMMRFLDRYYKLEARMTTQMNDLSDQNLQREGGSLRSHDKPSMAPCECYLCLRISGLKVRIVSAAKCLLNSLNWKNTLETKHSAASGKIQDEGIPTFLFRSIVTPYLAIW